MARTTAAPQPPTKADRTPTRRNARLRAGALAAAVSALCWCEPTRAADTLVCERAMVAAARENDVPLDILYSVGLTETGHRGVLGPFDLNVDGRSIHNETLPQALSAYADADRAGARFIDIGCMQINHHYHAAHFGTLTEMFDPQRNVRYAAALLKTLRAQEGTWTMAVARYNAGPDNPLAQKRYVCGVIAHMVESGVGAWTPNARAFCG